MKKKDISSKLIGYLIGGDIMKNEMVKKIITIQVLITMTLSFVIIPVNAATMSPNFTATESNIETNSTDVIATGIDENGFTWETVDGVSYTITGYNGSDTNITIPSSIDGHAVTKIGDNSFKDKALTSVVIPNTVTSIGNFAFYYNTSLLNVTIPNSVTSIGDSAFAYCTSLESITLPINLEKIGNSTFQDCKALKEITIPSSVKSIGSYAFFECFSLTNITIPDGVTYIGEGAFKDCKKLKSVYIPDSVTSVGNYLFYNCQQLTDVRLSNNLTTTGDFMFYNCFALEGVTLPSNLKIIGNSSFENCTSLKTIIIPDGVTKIGYRAFIMCNLLENVTIPNTVQIIDFNAFAHCYRFTNIVIPDSVKSIGDYAFYYNTNLTEITIPNSVTDIGFLTFASTNPSFKIKGDGGSYAQSYARSNSILFEALHTTKHTVSFNSVGGSVIDSVQVDSGNLMSVTTNPIKKGYTFVGWYKEANYITKWDFTTDTVTNNLTLFAKWKQNPTIPQNVKLVSTYDSNSLTWNPVTGASGYEVWKSTGSSGNYSLVNTTTTTSYKNIWLATGSTYNYKVRSYSMDGTVKVYSDFTPISTATNILPAPTGVKTTLTAYDSISISWNWIAGASGYEVWRSIDNSGNYSLVNTTTTTSYKNIWLATGSTYNYKVRSYRMVGNVKVYSSFSPITSVKLPLVVPTNFKATRTSASTINTSWNAVPGASGYEVYRATSSGGWYQLLGTTTATSFGNWLWLPKGKTYYYKIRAYKMIGTTKVYSNFTSVMKATTY